MARYRSRGMALRPINRIKHVVDSSSTDAAAATGSHTIASATDTPTLGATASVETGSKISWFYIRFEAASNEAIDLGAIPNYYWYLAKNPAGEVALPVPNAVGGNDAKRWVIHQEMTMIENKGQGSNPRTIFNGVIKVPRGMQRMGPSDVWIIHTLSPALNTAACVQVHYKEFR